LRFPGHVQRLGCWDDAELFALDADETDRADPDLLVDPLAAVVQMAFADLWVSFFVQKRYRKQPANGGLDNLS
jgi:hypothetical protein